MTVLEKSPIYQEILEKGVEQGLERGLEQGLEQGLERGLEQGLERGLEQSILRVLQRRFGEVPHDAAEGLVRFTSVELDALLDAALLAPDLEAFLQEMDKLD